MVDSAQRRQAGGRARLLPAAAICVMLGCAPHLQSSFELTTPQRWTQPDDKYLTLVRANRRLLDDAKLGAIDDPLCKAIIEGRHARVKGLIALGADVHRARKLDGVFEEIENRHRDRAGIVTTLHPSMLIAPPLHIAALRSDAEMVKLLLAAGARVNEGGLFTPLLAATERTPSEVSAAVIETLLAAGAHPDALPGYPRISPAQAKEAASRLAQAEVEYALATREGRQPASWASHEIWKRDSERINGPLRGDTSTAGNAVACMRDVRSDWHPLCANQCSPLQRVLMRPHPTSRRKGWLTGWIITSSERVRGGQFETTFERGRWPTDDELRAPRERIVRALLDAGANANPAPQWFEQYAQRMSSNALQGQWSAGRNCPAPLWGAAGRGLSDELLVKLSAATEQEGGEGGEGGWQEEIHDGLEVLLLERQEELAWHILGRHASRLRQHELSFALDLAARRGSAGLVSALVATGARPSAVDNTGRQHPPALVSAAAHCDGIALDVLLKAKADPNRPDSDGRRPLDHACPKLAPTLKKAGATKASPQEIAQIASDREAAREKARRSIQEQREFQKQLDDGTREFLAQDKRDYNAAMERRRRMDEAERASRARAISQGVASGLDHAQRELAGPSYPATGSQVSPTTSDGTSSGGNSGGVTLQSTTVKAREASSSASTKGADGSRHSACVRAFDVYTKCDSSCGLWNMVPSQRDKACEKACWAAKEAACPSGQKHHSENQGCKNCAINR